MAFSNSMPTARDDPRSLCVRTVVTPQAALMSTSSMLDSVTQAVLHSAGTTAARPMTTAALHPQTVNSTHICCTQTLHTTCSAYSNSVSIL